VIFEQNVGVLLKKRTLKLSNVVDFSRFDELHCICGGECLLEQRRCGIHIFEDKTHLNLQTLINLAFGAIIVNAENLELNHLKSRVAKTY
jgi:hypothetical protein